MEGFYVRGFTIGNVVSAPGVGQPLTAESPKQPRLSDGAKPMYNHVGNDTAFPDIKL
jgi:hypothetical protein